MKREEEEIDTGSAASFRVRMAEPPNVHRNPMIGFVSLRSLHREVELRRKQKERKDHAYDVVFYDSDSHILAIQIIIRAIIIVFILIDYFPH